MIQHQGIKRAELRIKIRNGMILLAGNSKLRIYGQLKCASGKRMKSANRVFFKNEDEARLLGYRPCGNCMRKEYQNWKDGAI